MADSLALARPVQVNGSDPIRINFPEKLYDMINNPETDEFIYWAPDGKSFFVSNQEYFSRELLPKSFRHKNFASFVRQLNMYGFRKIPQLHQGALKNETEAELCQFMNSRFQRGTLDLEGPIKRKKSAPGSAPGEAGEDEGTSSGVASGRGSSGSPDGITVGSVALQSLTNELGAIKRHQAAISSDLKELQESIQQLWHETFKSKDGQQQLQDTINKILKFLAGMFGKSAGAAGSTTQTAGMPTNGGFVVMPRKNARLMIDDGKDEERQVSVNLSEMDDIVETNLPGMSEDSDMLSESADGAHLSEAACGPMDATFFASQTESGQTRLPLVASDSMRLTLFAPVPPINTDANHPALPREKHRVQAQLSTTSSDLLRSTSISSKMPPFSHPSALHPNDPTTSSIPLTSINAATSSSAPAHKPFSSTALASTSIPGSPAPGAIDDPGLQANLLNILLSSASGRQRILDVLTPQVNTQLVPDLVPQPLISQQFQPSPAGINSVTPHPLQDTNPSSYHPDAQNQITLSPQLSIDGGPNSLWNMLGACGAGPQLDPSFTNMDTASRASSLAQSNAQLQRTFQSAADVDNRINTLQSYLGGYAPDSGVQDESMPLHSEFDASNFFGPFGVGELDTHLDAQLGDAFNLGPENADEFSSMPTSHLGTYVDEAGSASPTSSPKVPSIIWNNPVIVGEVDSDWAMGVAG